ncbi:MAG: M15 family metallopeptidase [Gemmatimonadota bacterium]|nr:MAG: M15 family metallopeptidase [Gemmatimonadota bacterium]
MPAFGSTSKSNLATVHPALQAVFNKVIEVYDCSVISGRRSAEEQQQLYAEGRSQKDGVTNLSKHQPEAWPDGPKDADGIVLVGAVDVAPYPINWENRERFLHFAGYVIGVARTMGVVLRWGGDWDSDVYVNDNGLRDQTFFDLPHYEILSLSDDWR